MIESEDAKKVLEVISENLVSVSRNPQNFQKLPDSFWGYYARGHDKKGKFGVIITYSEEGGDVESLIKSYQEWLEKNKEKDGNR